jgi:hypothetical protein
LYLRSVLMRRFQSELELVIRAMGIATILLMDTAITRTDTTGLIGTTAIPEAPRTTGTGTVTTATIGIIITIGTKLA